MTSIARIMNNSSDSMGPQMQGGQSHQSPFSQSPSSLAPVGHPAPSTFNFSVPSSPSPLAPVGQPPASTFSFSVPSSMHLTPVRPPIVKRVFIDRLAHDFQLEDKQRKDLHTFAALGSLGEGLSQADLATRLYAVAVTFSDVAERRRRAAEAAVDNVKDLFADLAIRLHDTFVFTKEQRGNILGVAQDVMYQANRTSYMTIHIDVEKILREDRVNMKMINVFGIPVREKAAASLIKKTCSSGRNHLREDLRDGITGPNTMSLTRFTYMATEKYRRGAVDHSQDVGYSVRNAILRRFGLDNLSLISAVIVKPVEHNEDEDEDEYDIPAPSAPKKRKVRSGGRVPKGQDFWSRVDAWFIEEIKEKGRSLTGASWKSYVNDCIQRDNLLFDNSEPAYGACPPVSLNAVAGTSQQPLPAVNPFAGQNMMDLV